jgi:hypothetical protein
LVIPDNVIHNGEIYQVKGIDEYSFTNTSLTENLTIPNGITSIGSNAFKNCNTITGDLTIPGSVKTIGVGAFEGCNGYTGNLTIESGTETIGERAFHSVGFAGILTIPNTVQVIGDNAFDECANISTINLSGFTSVPT